MTRLAYNGCFMTLPGAKEQPWHADFEHLFTSERNFQYWRTDCGVGEDFKCSDGKGCTMNQNYQILPAHCILVFVPLVDVGPENGATEFCLGSHFNTKFSPDDIVTQDTTWLRRIGFDGEIKTMKVYLRYFIYIGRHVNHMIY